jgi:hypothetical protein
MAGFIAKRICNLDHQMDGIRKGVGCMKEHCSCLRTLPLVGRKFGMNCILKAKFLRCLLTLHAIKRMGSGGTAPQILGPAIA